MSSEEAPEPNPDRITKRHFRAYALTWTSYASYYLGRKGFSVTKSSILDELGPTALRGVETAYLAAYAVGQYISGNAGDKIGARRLIGYGMLGAAAACALFGLSGLWILFFLAYMLNGAFQSTGWPGNVKAMAEWTTAKNRGGVMGLWATCYQVGGIVATGLATFLFTHYGWRSAYLVPAALIAVVGLGVLAGLKPGPGAGKHEAGSKEQTAEEKAAQKESQRRVLRSPLLWCLGLSYFNLKLIRYSLLFWLPFYLEKGLGYSKSDAGYSSTSFEIGGVVGTILIGLLSDRMRHIPRSVVAAISCVGLAGALYAYGAFGGLSMGINFALMSLVGALLFGPDTLISGAAAQDAAGPQSAALAAGIINGIGSVGAVAQETVTTGVSGAYGWEALFQVFLGLSILSAIILIPTFKLSKRSVAA